MRMWKVDPKILCNKHLLGMHVEMHMFLGTLQKKKSITGYIKNDLFEPLKLKEFHDAIANEMIQRNMNHKTPLDYNNKIFNYLTEEELHHSINGKKSLKELNRRCNNCLKNQ